jgi:hypothetical protein
LVRFLPRPMAGSNGLRLVCRLPAFEARAMNTKRLTLTLALRRPLPQQYVN